MKKLARFGTGLFAITSFATAQAQDSVSKVHCLPGDGISPYSTSASPLGSEQQNDYVVDATDLFTSWGNNFVVAPIAKSSHLNSTYFSALMWSQGISRRFLTNKSFVRSSYPVWTGQPGTGVNNDPSINDAPVATVNTAGKKGIQFGATFAEFDSTDQVPTGSIYGGIVTSVVNIDPQDPRRLYVTRVQSAINSPDELHGNSTAYVGGVDANGNTSVRADGNAMTQPFPGQTVMNGNNYFLIDALGRNTANANVLSNDFPLGGFDAASTKWVVRNSTVTHNTPSLMPSEVFGQSAILGSNFSKQFVRGTDFGLVTADLSQLPTGVGDHRGGVSYLSKNFAFLGSTNGLAAVLGQTTVTDNMIVFGLDAALNVSGKIGLQLPATITDNQTGYVNQTPGPNQFDNYHSQVAFDGGNGQIALNLDAQGNLLAAAEVSQPTFISSSNPLNYIAVAKVSPTGVVSWTMAGYCDSSLSGSGKPILDGPGGNVIGQMVPTTKLTTVKGPSMSSPMIDGAGNVWFISAVEMFNGTAPLFALLRSVYDPANFKYELEMVAELGHVFTGINSGTNFALTDLRLSDSNSIDSATAWSNNITENGFMGIDGACFDPSDPRSTGGLVINAGITYDTDNNGLFQACDPLNPTVSQDEQYRVLLYIGANGSTGIQNYGVGCGGSAGVVPSLSITGLAKSNCTIDFTISGGIGGQSAIVFLGLVPGSVAIPGACHLLVTPLLPISFTLPLFGSATPGGGSISFPATIPTVPSGFTTTLQAFCIDPGVFWGFSATQGVQLTFQ